MVKKLSYIFVFFVVVIVVSACNSEQKDSIKQANTTTITDRGFEERSEWCSDFDLTSEEAETFLNNANEVTASEYHNQYEHIGCYVKGTTIYKDAQCDITIWAGATAELQCGKEEYLLRCDDCEFVGSK